MQPKQILTWHHHCICHKHRVHHFHSNFHPGKDENGTKLIQILNHRVQVHYNIKHKIVTKIRNCKLRAKTNQQLGRLWFHQLPPRTLFNIAFNRIWMSATSIPIELTPEFHISLLRRNSCFYVGTKFLGSIGKFTNRTLH